MAIRIDTMEQFLRVRDNLDPDCITSKTHGEIPVPCTRTVLVRTSLVVANQYNPNSVPPDRLALLEQSVLDNGFLFPIATICDGEQELFVIVDGFHRHLILGPDWLDCDYLPVIVLNKSMAQRMIATMQLNKARGVHQVDLDAEVIRGLIGQGMTDEEIATHLGIDLDTVHRYKQVTGIAELFRDVDYSTTWSMVDD